MGHQLYNHPRQLNLSTSLAILPGAKAYFFLSGTTTPATTYQDALLTTPHANPVVANAAGIFAPIYLNSSIQYKVELQDTNGAVISGYPVDPCNDADDLNLSSPVFFNDNLTIDITHASASLIYTGGAGKTLTLPAGVFSAGTRIDLYQAGTNTLALAAGVGAAISWYTGAAVTGGSRTLAVGCWARLHYQALFGIWNLSGVGIT